LRELNRAGHGGDSELRRASTVRRVVSEELSDERQTPGDDVWVMLVFLLGWCVAELLGWHVRCEGRGGTAFSQRA
jgi:hypothetical protein